MNVNESKQNVKNLVGVAAAVCYSVGYKGEFTSLSTVDTLTLSGEDGDVIVFGLGDDDGESFYRIHHTGLDGNVLIATVGAVLVDGELIVAGLKDSVHYHVTVDCDDNLGATDDYRNVVRRVDVTSMLGDVGEFQMA